MPLVKVIIITTTCIIVIISVVVVVVNAAAVVVVVVVEFRVYVWYDALNYPSKRMTCYISDSCSSFFTMFSQPQFKA